MVLALMTPLLRLEIFAGRFREERLAAFRNADPACGDES